MIFDKKTILIIGGTGSLGKVFVKRALSGELGTPKKIIAVVVTHELNLAAELADYLILLDGGRCVRQGEPDAVLESALLSRVFRTPVLVDRNPSSGRPRITWVAP